MPTATPHLRRLLSAFASACLSLFTAPLFAQAGVEYAVKATYLYKFVPFVEWPAGTFASPVDPFVICIAGTDAVSDLVDEAVKGQRVGGHAIEVVHLSATRMADARCQLLYIAEHGAQAATTLERVRGKPVLTVTDDARDAHGIANFVVQGNRVRFEIDQNAAAENGLAISSKLLDLAVRVRPKL